MDSYFNKVLQNASQKTETTETIPYSPHKTTNQFLRFLPGVIMFAWLLLLACFPKSEQATKISVKESTNLKGTHAIISVSSVVVK